MNLCDLISAFSIDLIITDEFRFLVHLKLSDTVTMSVGVGEGYYCAPREKIRNLNGYTQVEAQFFYTGSDKEFHADTYIPEAHPLREEYLQIFETVDNDLATYADIETLFGLATLIARRSSNV